MASGYRFLCTTDFSITRKLYDCSMKTTLDIDDALLVKAKAAAARGTHAPSR